MVIGLAFLIAAAVAQSLNAPQTLSIYLGIAGLLVLASAFAVRDTSRPKEDQPEGYWQLTGQRFHDPATGRMMEIRHNPVTGERDYVEVKDS